MPPMALGTPQDHSLLLLTYVILLFPSPVTFLSDCASAPPFTEVVPRALSWASSLSPALLPGWSHSPPHLHTAFTSVPMTPTSPPAPSLSPEVPTHSPDSSGLREHKQGLQRGERTEGVGRLNPPTEVGVGSVHLPGATPPALCTPGPHAWCTHTHTHGHALDSIPGEQELSQPLGCPHTWGSSWL